MKTRRLLMGASGALLFSIGLFPALRAEAVPVPLGAVASANQEVTGPGAGDLGAAATVDLTIDALNGQICVQSSITGLSGAITAAHIHSGGFGVNGPVVVPLPITATTVAGCTTTTPSQAQAILNAPNSFYFNAHTAASPGGALRGQITATMLSASMTGAAEVPGPGDPDGTGSAVVAVDMTANQACVWFSFTAIDTPVAAHIHSGAVGVSGPVVLPLPTPSAAISASCGTAAPAVVSAIAASPSSHYLNVHTGPFPGGALRGNLSQRIVSGSAGPTGTPIVLAPATAAPTTAATTTATPVTTAAPTTTVAPTTTAAPTTTLAPTTTTATTAVAGDTAVPAKPITGDPTYTG